MDIILSFSSLCFLLVIGKVLRVKVKLLQRLYLPTSVIGGLFGLLVLQVFGSFIPAACTAGWERLPGFLINIVFAALFLGMHIPPISQIWKKAGPQLAYGQIVAWGQYVVGLGVSMFLLSKLFSVPGFFGVIMPVGFEGGHGTAAGLKATFDMLGWPQGEDFALASATAGIVCAIIIGTMFINWAVRRNITSKLKNIVDMPESNLIGIYDIDKRPVAGYQTVSANSVDSLAFHLAVIGIAIFIGYLIKTILLKIGTYSTSATLNEVLNAFPVFPLCMIGGVIVQLFASRVVKTDVIDKALMNRISGTALDFLVLSAIAMISLPVIFKHLWPFIIIILAGILWHVFCLMFLAKRFLPDAWFERGLVEMGQSMGVTATGLMLLRVVDPDHETPTFYAFGYKQLLHEPIMGGGLWTSIAIPLAITKGPFIVFIISGIAILIWLVVWWCVFRKQIKQSQMGVNK